jgi:hypothetical protein
VYEEDTFRCVVVLTKDSVAVDSNADEATPYHRLERLAARTEHDNAVVARVRDDELVKGRARDGGRTVEHADADLADELAVHAEHAHAVTVTVGDCDVTVPGHEAESKRPVQLTVAAAFGPEATKKSAVVTVEHAEARGIL